MKFEKVLFVAGTLFWRHGRYARTNVATAEFFFQALALLVLSFVLGSSKLLHIRSTMLLVPVLLFSDDLLARDYLGQRLFLFAASIGS